MTETLDITFDKDYKKRLLRIIKDSLNGIKLTNGDIFILFHWVRHQDDPAYNFVPKKFRTVGGSTKWAIKKI